MWRLTIRMIRCGVMKLRPSELLASLMSVRRRYSGISPARRGPFHVTCKYTERICEFLGCAENMNRFECLAGQVLGPRG